jgi:TatD DNase family protein
VELADSHCHLDDAQFSGDRSTAIERALEAGVRHMLAIGTGNGPPDLEAAVRIAEAHSSVYATAGVHPNDAAKVDATTFADLQTLLAHPKVKAIGEIGLDYHWGVPKEKQVPVFVLQLEIAQEYRLPVIIHTRDAWEDTIDLLRTHWKDPNLPCILHCFTGDAEQARQGLDLGCQLAFGGVTTFPKATAIREAARITPAERLLLETDCPYLAPVPHRGRRNEPAFLLHTAAVIADVRGIAVEELGAFTTENFKHVFRIDNSQSLNETASYT